MKKRFFQSLFCLLVAVANAQNPLQDIPAQELPPYIQRWQLPEEQTGVLGNLRRDSTHNFNKPGGPTSDWALAGKQFYGFDCTIQKPLSLLSGSIQQDSFVPNYRNEYNYYPGTAIQHELKYYNWSESASDWVHIIYDADTHTGQDSVYWIYTILSNWMPLEGYKLEYAYDANDRLVQLDSFAYSQPSGDWQHALRTSFTYDSNGKLQTRLLQQVFGTNFINVSRWTYEYGSNGQYATILKEKNQGGQWANDIRTNFTYDANDLLTLKMEETYTGFDWYASRRTTIAYNTMNKKTSLLVERGFPSGTWLNVEREQLYYYPNGDSSSYKRNIWVQSPASWVTKEVDSLNQLGQQVFYVFKPDYDPNTNSFYYGVRGHATYQGDNISEVIYDNLNTGTLDEWTASGKANYTYDPTGMASETLIQSYWNAGENQFVEYSKDQYFNSPCETGAAGDGLAHIVEPCRFPNPYQSGQAIQFDAPLAPNADVSLSLYDPTGRLVRSQSLSDGNQLNTDGLAKGLYLLLVRADQHPVCQGKLLLR